MPNTTNSVNEKIKFSWHPLKEDFESNHKYATGWQVLESDINQVARTIASHSWCPGIFLNGHRSKSDFMSAHLGALDFDGTHDIDEISKIFCDTISIIGTTKRHTEQDHRFRVVFLWETPITCPEIYSYNIQKLTKKYDVIADSQAFEASHKFWSCKEIRQIVTDGYRQPVESIPPDFVTSNEREQQKFKYYKKLGAADLFPIEISRWLIGENVDGRRNVLCHRVAKYLYWWGMDEKTIVDLIVDSKLPREFYKSKREAANAARNGITRAKEIERRGETKKTGQDTTCGNLQGVSASNQPLEL